MAALQSTGMVSARETVCIVIVEWFTTVVLEFVHSSRSDSSILESLIIGHAHRLDKLALLQNMFREELRNWYRWME